MSQATGQPAPKLLDRDSAEVRIRHHPERHGMRRGRGVPLASGGYRSRQRLDTESSTLRGLRDRCDNAVSSVSE